MSQTRVTYSDSDIPVTESLLIDYQTVALLTFKVAGQRYGLPITDVVRIIEMVTITHLPEAPEVIQGVINLHGKIVPVIDLHQRFGHPRPTYGLHTPIILVDMGRGQIVGLIVEAVDLVLEIPANDLELVDSVVSAELAERMAINAAPLIGIAKVDRQMILILNVQALLRSTEQVKLSQALSDGS